MEPTTGTGLNNMQMLNAPRAGWSGRARSPMSTGFAVVLVVGLHGLLYWALNSGLAAQFMRSTPVVVMAELLAAPQPVQPPATVVPQETKVALAKSPTPTLQSAPLPQAQTQPAAPALTAPVTAATAPVAATAAVAELVQTVKPVAAVPVHVAAVLNPSARCDTPEYPALSLRRQEEGVVQLRFLIGVDGQVLESRVDKSSGFIRLDEAARLALAKCQFKPGTLDGRPEAGWAALSYRWQIK